MSVFEPDDEPLHAVVENGIGFIVLNRPKVLNALSLPMIRAMRAALDQWRERTDVRAVVVSSSAARAFCAGADVRFLYDASMRGDVAAIGAYFTEEYALDHTIFRYPKPYIALMNGVVMGGGMGIAQGARCTGGLRVVTGATRMAMPETRIGLFVDVGAGWFLSRTPGAIGRYLAVTGVTIGARDALYAGLADIRIDADEVPVLLDRLRAETFRDGADVVAFVRRLADRPDRIAGADLNAGLGFVALPVARPWIDRHFGQRDVASIVASLEAESDPAAKAWADETIGVMRGRSPLSMAVSLEVVARGGGTMADCLRRDLDLTHSTFARGDVVEGVRARIIDKDDAPVWRIGRIEDVSVADVEHMFVSPWPAHAHPLRHLED
ncbi:enoyl-CoA hydratase/isomerase family protein [Paraburkholderia sp.]|uniref:enoyl-CoA hydratase/isomerase family protein n=1 Tax=Paraburkholderia sp. TaxID=1926495 RepID=UPI0039E4D894